MGEKRSGTREYLYVCFAWAIVICCSACAHDRPAAVAQPRTMTVLERLQHLEPVRMHIENRDFEPAIRFYQDMLSRPGGDNADLALFDLGLLYSHYANPRRDYPKSLLFFSRLSREYPRSPLAEEARIWANLLETLEKTKQVDFELEEKKKVLNKKEPVHGADNENIDR